MHGDMKFEESILTQYLVKNLEPLTEADPVILAEYVATLLKKDGPTQELQKVCTENLVEFLGTDTKSFVTKLFQDLENDLILSSTERQESIKQAEPSPALTISDPGRRESLSPKLEKFSSSGGPVADPEEKEVSDDDDDDRNHKHRRRGTRSLSSDKDSHEQIFKRQNRKRDKPFENGQSFLGNDPQSSGFRSEGVKFEKRRAGLAPLPHTPLDLGQRTRLSQTIHSDTPRFDMSTSVGRLPIGRGRGRNNALWNQHDSRFGSVETPDFSPQMAPQGPIHPSLFAGRGIPDAAATQSASWGAFGLIHGLSNGGLDTLHPLGLQGALRPAISPLNIGIPRQRCRDFEERGFCLRGDMCPMEHGVNRIVVEDVQSLSQFNLPVSVPSARLLGVQGGSGPLPPITSSPRTLPNSKNLHVKISMPGVTDDGSGLNGAFPVSADAGEADLYDPDQPLWNNNHPETTALLRLASPNFEDTEPLMDADPADHHSFRSADGNDSEHLGRGPAAAVGSQSTALSVWGRIGNSGNKLEVAGKIESTVSVTGYLGNERKEDQEETLNNIRGSSQQGKRAITEAVGSKTNNLFSTPKLRTDFGSHVGRASQKAQRTLFVSGVPLKNNKREALLSHFKKFGEVIDIYIPVNSEKAFVQFSKREEAEAALKAPDAVMGNRFIKLWWANRDTIPDGGCSGSVASVPCRGTITASVPPHPSIERSKETNPSAVPKLVATPVSDATMPAAAIPSRFAVTNGPKAIPPTQKKLETLELLKEELRKKQEMLDQKRNDFRRQLDKLEKQAITVKGETAFDQAVKRHNVVTVTDVVITSSPRHTNPAATGALLEAEKTSEKKISGENIVSSSAKINPTTLQHSPRSVKQPIRLPASGGSPFLANRFKLDNRPTTFIILPPLPADVANVSVLKEHFSSFGDLLRVELEDPEASDGSPRSKPSQNFSARITFLTHGSAQRAFVNGKCWQGHNFEFKWLTTISNCITDHSSIEIPPTTKGPADPENPMEASLATGKSMCSAISEPATAAGNRLLDSIDGMDGSPDCTPKGLVEACATKSLSDEQPPESDVPITGDGPNVSFAG